MKNSINFTMYMGIAALLGAVWFIAAHSAMLLTYMFWYIALICLWTYGGSLYRRSKRSEDVNDISQNQSHEILLNTESIFRMRWEAGMIYEHEDFKVTKVQRILLEFKKP